VVPTEAGLRALSFDITAWDLKSQKRAAGFERPGERGIAVLSPDGGRVLLIGWRTTPGGMPGLGPPKFVSVCDTRTGRELCSLAVPKDQPLLNAAILPDGQVLTVSVRDHAVRFWDGATGRPMRQFSLGGYSPAMIALSPDGRRLAGAGANQPDRAKVWDVSTGREIAALRGHSGHVTSLAFSPDGRRLATGGSDNVVIVWDVDTGRELLTLRGHSRGVYSLAFSPDGTRLASSSDVADRTTRIWDVRPPSDER
jgi:WD40 repeat protein